MTPATRDQKEGFMSSATTTRELAARESNGIHVLLLWHPAENSLTVEVEDDCLGDRFQLVGRAR